jgi:hypothetical protein
MHYFSHLDNLLNIIKLKTNQIGKIILALSTYFL